MLRFRHCGASARQLIGTAAGRLAAATIVVGCLATPAQAALGPYYAADARPFVVGNDQSIAFSPSGKFLATPGGSVSMWAVHPDGQLVAVPGDHGTLPDGDQVVFSPSGDLLADVASQSGRVYVFAVDTTGHLQAVPGSPFATGNTPSGPGSIPLSVAFSSDGHLLATADAESGTVSIFSVRPNGSLHAVAGSPFKAGGQAEWVTFSPAGGLLATANGDSNTVSVMSVSGGGKLGQPVVTKVAAGSFNGDTFSSRPAQVLFSPSGGQLVSENTSSVSVFSVHSDGTLSEVSGSPYAAAFEPAGIAFDRTGDELVEGTAGQGITTWPVGAGGQLGQATAYATVVPPVSLAFSSSGLIAVGDGQNEVEVLTTVRPRIRALRRALARALAVRGKERKNRWTLLGNGGYNVDGEFVSDNNRKQLTATGGLGPGALQISWSVRRLRTGRPAQTVVIAQASTQFTFQNLGFGGIPLTRAGKRVLKQERVLHVTATGSFNDGDARIYATRHFTLKPCPTKLCRFYVKSS